VGEHKRSACHVLAANVERIPDAVQAQLRELVPRLGTGAPFDGLLGRPLGGKADELAAALGAIDADELSVRIVALLAGNRQQRCDAATVIGRVSTEDHTAALIAQLADAHADVRAAAAYVLATRLSRSDFGGEPLLLAGVRRALDDPGALVPLAVANGLVSEDETSPFAREFVELLRGHPSARVRLTVAGHGETA
jgi:HEAT repeat protein